VDPEKARALARRSLISTLSHQERTMSQHESESLPDDRKTYRNGEAWGFDTQEYAKSSQGYCLAVTFVDHNTVLPWSVYKKDKDDGKFMESVTELIFSPRLLCESN
jgi:hypothetical protein